ncbi:MAG TPA: hypothetical protein VI603_09710 [Saprospiraceae bacterium]|nr:hypothetical protein [Saprospiraceae bacterium]
MKHFEQIDSYHHGTMSESEARAFEQSLSNNPEIKQEWEQYNLSRQVSGVLAYENAKRKISGMKQSSLHIAHRNSSTRQLLRIAAVLVMLVVFGFLFGQIRYTDTALASQHYRSTSVSMRSPQTNGAAKLIDDKKYEEAIALLQQTSATDPISKSLLAEALTKAERFPDAIKIYSELAADPQNINREGAEFALALLHLKSGDTKSATDLISKIAASEDHDYRFEARELEAQLKSFWRKLVF